MSVKENEWMYEGFLSKHKEKHTRIDNEKHENGLERLRLVVLAS